MSRPIVGAISPFFIVGDVDCTIAFYRDQLGFAVTFKDPETLPFFAIVLRDGAQLFFKSSAGVPPVPNVMRHPSLRWDAYVHTSDPDGLAAELLRRGAEFSSPLQDTPDGLRGFEITDPDGHVLFFGRPG